MPTIHPSAILSGEVSLADDVEIGPGCVLRGQGTGGIRLGQGVRLLGNVYLNGPLSIGAGTIVYPFACLGFEPQDFKFKPGTATAGAVIGENCLIREHVTVHAASNDHTPTRIGDRIFMMVASHVAHDCVVGNNVVMVNGAVLGGHSNVGDNVNLGGGAAIHQFVRIGRFAMVSGTAGATQDIPPFCMMINSRRVAGINVVGMRRNGFSRSDISAVRDAFRLVFRNPMPRPMMIQTLRGMADRSPLLVELADFVAATKRGITAGTGKPAPGAARFDEESVEA